MIPKILEYDEGRIKITAEAYAIPEIYSIIQKHDLKAEPYLSFVYSLSAPDSPYINYPEDERNDTLIFDVTSTLGEFDPEDELLQPAISKLKGMYASPIVQLAEELDQELHRLRQYLKYNPIRDGEGGNLADRRAILKEIDRIAMSYNKVKKQAEEEISAQTKGDHEVGEY